MQQSKSSDFPAWRYSANLTPAPYLPVSTVVLTNTEQPLFKGVKIQEDAGCSWMGRVGGGGGGEKGDQSEGMACGGRGGMKREQEKEEEEEEEGKR